VAGGRLGLLIFENRDLVAARRGPVVREEDGVLVAGEQRAVGSDQSRSAGGSGDLDDGAVGRADSAIGSDGSLADIAREDDPVHENVDGRGDIGCVNDANEGGLGIGCHVLASGENQSQKQRQSGGCRQAAWTHHQPTRA